MMDKIDSFSLSFEVEDGVYFERTHGELTLNKKRLGVILQGCVIEAQYQIEDHFLIITAQSDPYQEEVNIYYFTDDFILKDHLKMQNCVLITAYEALEKIKIMGDRILSFEFLTVKPWKLKVFLKPKPYLFVWHPINVFRPGKSYFDKVYLGISHYLSPIRQ
tara:strand:+ start:968 stop:1453 length:486 start_codon:yes stop_codon:yes gene_type:complete